jgi:Immunity protein 26
VISAVRAELLAARNRNRQNTPTQHSYGEGNWFAVPLPKDTGFAPGLIARAEPRQGGIMLCYFFAPRGYSEPTLGQLTEMRPADAVLIQKLARLGKEWPRLGHAPDWERGTWPVPAFRESVKKKDQPFKLIYDDSLAFVGAEVASHLELDGLPSNEVRSAASTGTALAHLLKDRSGPFLTTSP